MKFMQEFTCILSCAQNISLPTFALHVLKRRIYYRTAVTNIDLCFESSKLVASIAHFVHAQFV